MATINLYSHLNDLYRHIVGVFVRMRPLPRVPQHKRRLLLFVFLHLARVKRSYEQLLRLHITPKFGHKRLTEIKREQIKQHLGELSRVTKLVDEKTGATAPRFSRNSLRLIVCALRGVLNAAVEDGQMERNPASRVGKFAKTEKPDRQASAMNRDEAEKFLEGVKEICPEWHPFFLTALGAGLHRGELIALKWGDIQFGESESDSNRFILVQRNYVCDRFTSPKSKKSRRVDLSKQLRASLLAVRDTRLLESMLKGKTVSRTTWSSLPRPIRPLSRTTSPFVICSRRSTKPACGDSAFTI